MLIHWRTAGDNYFYTSGAPAENLWILLGLTLFYLALAWYFAQVFDSGNGTTQVFYFFLTRRYRSHAIYNWKLIGNRLLFPTLIFLY